MRWFSLMCLVLVSHAADALRLQPLLQRLDLVASDVIETTLTLHAPAGTPVTSVAVDCACIRLLTPLPATVPAAGVLDLHLRVTGLRPGVEDIVVVTTAGTVRAQIQIVGAGAGRGLDQLHAAMTAAHDHGWSIWGVVHDLAGTIRHCACSQGALGGIDRLATLPGLVPGSTSHWVLTGDGDGSRPGVGAALSRHGWQTGSPAIRVAADPLPLLGQPGITAVIPTTPVAVQHRRLVRPVLTGGLAVELLLVDAHGDIQERRTMPVDDSLPADPTILAGFPDTLSSTIDATARPSDTCASCHPTAVAAWSRTRHALALDSLQPADRTDACIRCHTTVVAARTLAPAVGCQSCHGGGDAHAVSRGTVRTAGAGDCRTCHDAQHHPGFRHDATWPRIQHGREPGTTP